MLDDVLTHHLDNGAALQLARRPGSPLVAVQAWIGAGSADDPPARSGLAHLVEHLVFKGSHRLGVPDLASEIEHRGGEINAWTSPDHTVFHAVAPRAQLEYTLDAMAEALGAPRFEPEALERERAVILEEMRHRRGALASQLARSVMASTFPSHPYHRPVIGDAAALAATTVRDVAEFYRTWYVAPNLTLVISGDVESAQVVRRAASTFGGLSSARTPARRSVAPPQRGPRVCTLEHVGAAALLALAFRVPALRDPDVAALDAAARILSQRSAGIAAAPHGYVRALRDGGLFVVEVAAEPKRAGGALAGLAKAVRALGEHVEPRELGRAQRGLELERLREHESVQGRARALGWYAATAGEPGFEERYAERLRRLRRTDVLAAARRHLRAEHAVVTALVPRGWRGRATFARSAAAKVRAVGSGAATAPAIAERRVVFPSGVTALLRADPQAPLVAMRASWSGGVSFEEERTRGATSLLARVLGRGCGKRTAAAVAERLDELGGALAGSASRESLGLSAELAADRWREGLELLADCVLTPRFDPVEVGAARRELLEELERQEALPGRRAYRLFLETLYGDHPARRDVLGTRTAVLGLGRDALRAFYRERFASAELVVTLVGAFDLDEAEAAVRARFAAGPRRKAPKPSAAPRREVRPVAEREVYLYLEGVAQAHLVIGFPGAPATAGDRLALEVLGAILDGQGGVLFQELREREGLAYQVAAHVTDGLDAGYLAVHVACADERLARVHEVIRAQLTRLVEQEPTAQELARARGRLIGARELALQRRAEVAAAMTVHELRGLGWQRWQDYASRVAAVTAAQVQAAAAAYLRWDAAVIATVRAPATTPGAERRGRRGRRARR